MKILVTPEMADQWLSRNDHNRRLNDRLVQDYARDMAAGKWMYNGEAIKVSEGGILLDGQHRAAAVKASGVSVWMEVIDGLPLEAQNTMDIGRKRSMGDMLAIDGEAYAHNLAAVARRAWQWDRKNYRFTPSPAPTPAEIRTTLERYPTLRRSAEIGHRIALGFRPVKASVVGTVHHLFLQIDPDATALFFAQFETGADLPQGHPVLILRNRFTQDKIQQRSLAFHQNVGCCIKAWNAVRKNEEISMLKMAPDTSMPMPV